MPHQAGRTHSANFDDLLQDPGQGNERCGHDIVAHEARKRGERLNVWGVHAF